MIKAAYVRGDALNEVVGAIKSATNGRVLRSAETLARTGAQHYAVQAREALFDENEDIITGYYYSATLDNRTTIFCASNDGKVFKPDEKRPRLPAHYNCRSSYIPLILGQQLPDGERPAVGAGEDYESGDKYTGRRSVKAGEFKVKQVKPSTNYESWLRRQPVAFQNDVLGVGKAKLFRKGASIGDFLDNAGRPLTLEQLKALDLG